MSTAIPEGSVYKRCSCKDPGTGKALGSKCPKLRRGGGGWHPTHGTWAYQIELPARPGEPRRPFRRGGFDGRDDANALRDRVKALLDLARGDAQRALEISDLIWATRRGQPLPDPDTITARLQAGVPASVTKTTAEGADLFFNEAAAVLGQGSVTVGRILLGTGTIAALLAFHNAITRYTFALGREGVLPRVFGRCTSKGAPRKASLAQTALALVVLIAYAVAGWDPLVQLFYWGSTAGGLGVLVLYTLTSIAVIAYFVRDSQGEKLWRRFIAPLIATVILLVVSYLAIDNLAALFGVDPGTGPARIVPLAYLAIFAAGSVWGLILKRTKPYVYDGIGRGTRSATASASGLSTIL